MIKRQDSFQREIMVLVLVGKYKTAIRYLDDNVFSAEEGREEIHDVYVDAHLLQGLCLLKQGKAADALGHFQRAEEYPENLSVGRPKNDPRAAQVAYHTGTAHEALSDLEMAQQFYRKAADQPDTNRWPETRFYQAMSLTKLGQADEARKICDWLVRTGQSRLAADDSADFFAKFGQQATRKTNTAAAHFILGLGFLGQGEVEKAIQQLQQATEMNRGHVWAAYQAASLD